MPGRLRLMIATQRTSRDGETELLHVYLIAKVFETLEAAVAFVVPRVVSDGHIHFEMAWWPIGLRPFTVLNLSTDGFPGMTEFLPIWAGDRIAAFCVR